MESLTAYVGIDRGMVTGKVVYLGDYAGDAPCLRRWRQDFKGNEFLLGGVWDDSYPASIDMPGRVGAYVTAEAFDRYMNTE